MKEYNLYVHFDNKEAFKEIKGIIGSYYLRTRKHRGGRLYFLSADEATAIEIHSTVGLVCKEYGEDNYDALRWNREGDVCFLSRGEWTFAPNLADK